MINERDPLLNKIFVAPNQMEFGRGLMFQQGIYKQLKENNIHLEKNNRLLKEQAEMQQKQNEQLCEQISILCQHIEEQNEKINSLTQAINITNNFYKGSQNVEHLNKQNNEIIMGQGVWPLDPTQGTMSEGNVYNFYNGSQNVQSLQNQTNIYNYYGTEAPELTEEDNVIVDELVEIFYGEKDVAADFVRKIKNKKPVEITRLVKQYKSSNTIIPSRCGRELFEILHKHGLYPRSYSNWMGQGVWPLDPLEQTWLKLDWNLICTWLTWFPNV